MLIGFLGKQRLMKIFDAKLIATSYLSNLIATRLLNYAKKAAFSPKNVFSLNLSGYHQASLKSIFPKAKVTDISFSDLKQTYFPATADNMNLLVANLAFARSPELITFFNETDRLMKDEDILLLAVNEQSEQHVRDSLENIDLNFIAFKEKIDFETATYHVFFASRDELTNLIYAMEPAIDDYTESDHGENEDNIDVESIEANDPIFDDDAEEAEIDELESDLEQTEDMEEVDEDSSLSDALEVEDEADLEGEGELDEESETDHESDSDQDADGDWEQDEAIDVDFELDEDDELEHEDDTELDDDSDLDDEEDDELDDSDELDEDEDEDLEDEEDDELDDDFDADELEDDEGELDGDGDPENDEPEPIVEEDKKNEVDNDADNDEENTKSFRR